MMSINNIYDLWFLIKPIRKRLVIACVLQFLSAITSIIPFAVIVHLAMTILDGTFSSESAGVLSLIVLLVVIARIGLSIGAGAISHFADNDFHYHIKLAMVDTLRSMPLLLFFKHHSGALKKNLQDDVATMHHLIAHFSLDITNAIVQPIVIICYLMTFSVPFTLIILLTPLLSFAAYMWQLNSFSKHLDEYNSYLMEINASTVELVQGIDVIKVFPRDTGVPKRFINATTGFVKAFGKWVKNLIIFSSAAEVLVSPLASVVWICATGLFFISNNYLDPISILPFLLVGAGLGSPLITLSGTISKLQAATESARKVIGLLNEPSLAYSDMPQIPAGIEIIFDNVTFGYDAKLPILKNISFDMPPSSLTALVGSSGAGKTTLAHLLLRFADPQNGHITIGGVNLKDIAQGELGTYVGFVFQDAYLIRASIFDNIRLARPSATMKEIIQAASNAQIHHKIMSYPNGYQSIVGVDTQFSGGERQRIAIARALLADTPILVLDEPTAHADPLSEAALQKAISFLAANKTLLVIAHKLNTIVRADQIIVLNEGKIMQAGTHEELLKEQGIYANLWSLSKKQADNSNFNIHPFTCVQGV